MNGPASFRTPEADRRDARTGRWLLALLLGSYFVFLCFYVPRLNNFVHSDREFTGWVGPMAERLARGERPYLDFVLPIPPGSFVLLALVQKLAGRPLLLQELWVAALSHLCMGLIAYAIAVRFSTRRVALLVTLVTLVILSQTPKECVYDHTSLLVAWVSMLTGLYAALEPTGRRRRWLWGVTGLLATFSLAFKQSTAAGAIAGWGLAVSYLVVVEWWQGRRESARERLMDAVACAAGGVAGFALVLLLLLSVRASVSGFVRTVLVDGPALKGGKLTLVRNLFNFTTRHDAIRNTFLPTALLLYIGLQFARRRGHVHIGDEPERRAPIERRSAILLGLAFVGTFGPAIFLLTAEVRAMHHVFTAIVDTLRNIPAYGFVFVTAFFVAHVSEEHAGSEERRNRGHALNAVFIAAAACSMIYDTSFILFSPFYYNEPTLPIAVLCLFIATERSAVIWATPLVVVASVLPLFGAKLNRALSDDTPVTGGHWAGLRVNYRGVEILKAAARAQGLAGKDGTVLVLPEDVEFAGLVHRRRPPIKGAIVFADQYPTRLLADDQKALDAHLPDVFIIHPHNPGAWQTMFHTWAENSGAERFINHVLTDILPKHYVLDATFPTIYFWDQGQIDVYVRKDLRDGAP